MRSSTCTTIHPPTCIFKFLPSFSWNHSFLNCMESANKVLPHRLIIHKQAKRERHPEPPLGHLTVTFQEVPLPMALLPLSMRNHLHDFFYMQHPALPFSFLGTWWRTHMSQEPLQPKCRGNMICTWLPLLLHGRSRTLGNKASFTRQHWFFLSFIA